MGRKSIIPELETKVGKPLNQYLAEAIKEGKKPPEIASEIGIGISSVYDFINQYGLKAKLREAGKMVLYARKGGELKDAIDEFLKAKESGDRSSKTLSNYKDALYAFLWWLDFTKKPTALAIFNSQVLNDFFYYLKTEPVRFGGKATSARRPLTSNTRFAYWRIFRGFGNWLVKMEKIEKNPIYKVEQPRREKRLPEDLPDEILTTILNSFNHDFTGIRNTAIILVFLDTGLRLDGNVNLEADTFDLETGKGKIIEKGNKERHIRLTTHTIEALKQYLELRNPIARTTKLWITPEGNHFKRDSLRQMVKALNQYDPENRIHPHLFRHIWAKYLAKADVNPFKAKLMGGWEDIRLYMMYAEAYSGEEAWEGYEEISPVTKLLGKEQ